MIGVWVILAVTLAAVVLIVFGYQRVSIPRLLLLKGFQKCLRNLGDFSFYPLLKTSKGAKVIVVNCSHTFPV